MKLKNKKTGEIVEFFVNFHEANGMNSVSNVTLEELCNEWIDYEEPKEFYYIDEHGNVCCKYLALVDNTATKKEIGNYFLSLEEAEKAVEKLKALTRLEDRGLKFKGISGYDEIHFWFPNPDDMFENSDTRKDLDLLFGGED